MTRRDKAVGGTALLLYVVISVALSISVLAQRKPGTGRQVPPPPPPVEHCCISLTWQFDNDGIDFKPNEIGMFRLGIAGTVGYSKPVPALHPHPDAYRITTVILKNEFWGRDLAASLQHGVVINRGARTVTLNGGIEGVDGPVGVTVK